MYKNIFNVSEALANKLFIILVFFSIILLFIVLNIANFHFYTDDSFITFRYAKNLASGLGITWNAQDIVKVEGYSNFLYVILSAFFESKSISSITAIKNINLISSALTLILLYRVCLHFVEPIYAILSPLILVSYEGFLFWSNSGLETPTYMLFILFSIISFFHAIEPRNRHSIIKKILWLSSAGVSVFICALLRPEGAIIGLAIGITFLIHLFKKIETRASILPIILYSKEMWVLILSFFIPYTSYFIWRFIYFNEFFPNTVYCKSGFTENPFILIESFFEVTYIYLILILFGFKSHLNLKSLTIILFVLISLAVLYNVDPIIGHKNRHTLAAYMFVSVLTVSSISLIIKNVKKRLFVLLSFVFLIIIPINISKVNKIQSSAIQYKFRMDAREKVGRFIKKNLTNKGWIAVGDCGMIPYISEVNVYDLYCLNSKEFVSSPINKDINKFSNWVIDQAPDSIIISSLNYYQLMPRSYIDKSLVENIFFKSNYHLVKKYGHKHFNYWIYMRKLK